jgi:hypothetical protein
MMPIDSCVKMRSWFAVWCSRFAVWCSERPPVPESGVLNSEACLDTSVAKGFAFLEPIQAGKEMLVRIVAMLTKLLVRFSPEQYRVQESAAG